MSTIKFYQVTSLPGTLESNAFYYVLNADFAESYLTNSTGVPKALGNSAMIQSIVAEYLASQGGASLSFTVAPTYADLTAAASSVTRPLMILVIDATGDATVSAGSALYAIVPDINEIAPPTIHKIAEYESMDVVLQWSAIQGRPASSAAQIDTAVSQSHTHANKAVLDKLTESSGQLFYNGAAVAPGWSTQNW